MARLESESQLRLKIEGVSARITDVQSGLSGYYVLLNHDPTGLGGQISRRILAIRIGLITGRTAVFPGEDFFPYENAFEPLAELPALQGDVPKLDLGDIESDPHPIVEFDFWAFDQDEALKEKVYSYVPDALAHLENAALLLDGIILSTFGLSPEYQQAIAAPIERIRSMSPVIGVHFRRGDKYIETPYVEASIYRAGIEALAERHGIRNVFVSSDSPLAVRELGLDPQKYNVYFDIEEKRYNNANSRFLMSNRALAHQETLTAIRNIYMLGHCDYLVGQSNAQFAKLGAARIMATTSTTDFGTLIVPRLVPAKWTRRILYKAYRGSRELAKKVLKSRTLKNVKGRLR